MKQACADPSQRFKHASRGSRAPAHLLDILGFVVGNLVIGDVAAESKTFKKEYRDEDIP